MKGRFDAKKVFKYSVVFALASILSGIAVIVISYLCISSCVKNVSNDISNDHRFLYEKMSEIPIEYNGYYMVLSNDSSDTNVFADEDRSEYSYLGNQLIVNKKYDETGAYRTITYDQKEISIDVEFLQEKSTAYDRINHIWDGKLNDNATPKISEIVGVTVYENIIFILTCGLSSSLNGAVKGQSPYVLYYYDMGTDTVYYCGFYSGNLNEYQRYDGFRTGTGKMLKIIKAE